MVRLGVSAAMQEIGRDIALAAQCSARVLITGENGVGKTAVARMIHETGQRAAGNFVAVDCEGMSDWALGGRLFGQVLKGHEIGRRIGAFEHADQGTLFLDEIGDVGSGVQARLVRYIDTGEVQPIASENALAPIDVRIITATSRPLDELVEAGQFRDDLFYRLNVIHIIVPPLRHRREDVVLLLNERLTRKAEASRVSPPALSSRALEQLTRYEWPGNVRELHGVADALVQRCPGRRVDVSDLPEAIARQSIVFRASARLRSSTRAARQARFLRAAWGPVVLQRVRAH